MVPIVMKTRKVVILRTAYPWPHDSKHGGHLHALLKWRSLKSRQAQITVFLSMPRLWAVSSWFFIVDIFQKIGYRNKQVRQTRDHYQTRSGKKSQQTK